MASLLQSFCSLLSQEVGETQVGKLLTVYRPLKYLSVSAARMGVTGISKLFLYRTSS